MTREQLPEFKEIGVVGQPRPGRTLSQNRENSGREKIADVLEEIWRTADRKGPMADVGRWSGLFRKVRGVLVRTWGDAFGTCLCCRTAIGLRRLRAVPWAALCIPCQKAADRDDSEALRVRSRG